MYRVEGTATSAEYFDVYFISIEYSDTYKGQFTLDSLTEAISVSFVENPGPTTPIVVNGNNFNYVQGYAPGFSDPSLFALGSDGDNSYAGFVMFFNTGLETPEQAMSFFDKVINEVNFK